jgi:hypothetical protein
MVAHFAQARAEPGFRHHLCAVNVAFHQLVGIAITHETAAWMGAPLEAPDPAARTRATIWATAFGLAILSHGVLDALPHYYPLSSAADTLVSLALVAVWLCLIPRWLRGPLLLVGVGALLPDIIDHVPDDLRKHLGWNIPVPPNLFPWHWPTGSGSLPGRTGPLWIESLTYHLIVVIFCAVAIARTSHLLRRRR